MVGVCSPCRRLRGSCRTKGNRSPSGWSSIPGARSCLPAPHRDAARRLALGDLLYLQATACARAWGPAQFFVSALQIDPDAWLSPSGARFAGCGGRSQNQEPCSLLEIPAKACALPTTLRVAVASQHIWDDADQRFSTLISTPAREAGTQVVAELTPPLARARWSLRNDPQPSLLRRVIFEKVQPAKRRPPGYHVREVLGRLECP